MRTILIATMAAAAALASPAQAQPRPPEGDPAQSLEAARSALLELDAERLGRDRAYAARILPQLDRLADWEGADPILRRAARGYRLLAWSTLGRTDDIAAASDALVAQGSDEPIAYGPAVYATLVTEDRARAVALVEAASRNVRGIGRPALRELLGDDNMGHLLGDLERRGEDALQVRLAEALFRIGWPSDGDPARTDRVRMILIDEMLRREEPAAAAEYASGLASPDGMLRLIVQRRYDPLIPPGRERIAMLEDVLAARDRATAAALAGSPADRKRLLDRAQHLRGVGRNAEVWELVAPLAADVPGVVGAGEDGMWLLNEGAYALLAEGREDEAVALMARMTAIPLAERPNLISASINYGALLVDAGRHAAAVDHARSLAEQEENFASPYGNMWIYNTVVCGLAGLDRRDEAAPWLERMVALGEEANDAALTQAHLCLGDEDAAAALLVKRLEGDKPGPAILALQDYGLSRGPGQIGRLHERLIALRDRPEVRAALDRVGHVLTLPLARTYWGNF